MLGSLSKLLDEGAAHASKSGVDLSVLVEARLAPDMYTLARQVQLACCHANDVAARLTGREPAAPGDADATFERMKVRIETTVEGLLEIPPAAFDGAGDREIVIPIIGAEAAFEMKGHQFLRDWALPHFHFHVVTAYDILRHEGVDIGKRDYLASVGGHIRPRAATP